MLELVKTIGIGVVVYLVGIIILELIYYWLRVKGGGPRTNWQGRPYYHQPYNKKGAKHV